MLAYADFKAPFILHTDASGDGLGAVFVSGPGGETESHSIFLSESDKECKELSSSPNWNSWP